MLGVRCKSSLRAVAWGCAILGLAAAQFLSASAQAQSSDAAAQTWVDETGQHKIQAKFVKLDGPNVVLLTAEGKQINVPYAKLSLSSQFRAKKAADPKAFEAPPLPSTFAPPPLAASPFPEDSTIEQYIDTLFNELKAGRAEVVWHAIPPDMRTDAEAILVKGAEVLGPRTFKQIQAVLPNALTIVRDKRSFIIGNPRVARQPELAKSLQQILPATEPMIELLTRPATWSSENFKSGNVGPWLMLFANDSLNAYQKMTASLKPILAARGLPVGDLKDIKYKVLEKTADSASVEFTAPRMPKQVTKYKKVNGHWLSGEFEKQQAAWASARSTLENMDKAAIDQMRTVVSTQLTILNGVLGSLANAKTQQEFNVLIDPLLNEMEKHLRKLLPTQDGRMGPGMAGMGPGMGSGSMPNGATLGSGGMEPNGATLGSGSLLNSGGEVNSGGSTP